SKSLQHSVEPVRVDLPAQRAEPPFATGRGLFLLRAQQAREAAGSPSHQLTYVVVDADEIENTARTSGQQAKRQVIKYEVAHPCRKAISQSLRITCDYMRRTMG